MIKIKGIKIKDFYGQYEYYLSPVALIAGFTWDNLTLRRIDLLFDNLVILSYLVLALITIILLNARKAGKLMNGFFDKVEPALPFVLQFVFGGLFSAFVIFYMRSASILSSWPFLLMLTFLLVGNEVFRKKYYRLTFHLSIYFIALFSYAVFSVPVLLGSIEAWVFIVSGVVSLVAIGIVISLLRLFMPKKIKASRKSLLISITSIYLIFNICYFTNIIPPIPLSLKEFGVYHSIQRTTNGYKVSLEPSSKYDLFKDYSSNFHWRKGEPVYVFSSIFAPTKISTDIYHRWSFYNEKSGEWIERDSLSFSIAGGRDGGYRGYSFKYGVNPGKWKVEVMTKRGQILGYDTFTIIETKENIKIDTKIIK